MPHPNAFFQTHLRGQNFLTENIGVFNNIFAKKYVGCDSSVVEQSSSNPRVMSSNPGGAKTFFLEFTIILIFQ